MADEAEKNKLREILSDFDLIVVISIIKSPFEAIEILSNSKIEILFIDTAYCYVLQNMTRPPFTVGISTYDNHASISDLLAQGLFDIIFLPFNEKQVINVLSKIVNIHGYYAQSNEIRYISEEISPVYNSKQINDLASNKEYMFIQGNQKKESVKIYFREILFINNVGNEIRLNFDNGTVKYVRTSLAGFLKKLPENKFIRINRSIIVNIDRVMMVNKKNITIGDENFTVSRSYYKNFISMLNIR